MIEFDLGESRAVLLGTWSYESENLPDVPAARHSLNRMHSVLTSDICGWPESSITSIPNPEYPADLPDRLVRLFAEVRDVALFYFVGHGQVDEEDQLSLCMARSVTESPRRSTTGLGYGAVRRALRQSPARMKIVMLDCCYSGIATEHSMSSSGCADDLALRARANGVYTMTACGPYAAAWFEPTGASPLTYFTKHLAEVLEGGIAGQPGRLRLNPIFMEIRSRLVADGKPEPKKRASDTADEFEFARNLAPRSQQRDPDQENSTLRENLAARERELETARRESDQLTDELNRMRNLMAAENAPSSELMRQQTDRLADELRVSDARVLETQARVDELAGSVSEDTAESVRHPRRKLLTLVAVPLSAVALIVATSPLWGSDAGGGSPPGNAPSAEATSHTPKAYTVTARVLKDFMVRVDVDRVIVSMTRPTADLGSIDQLRFFSPAVVAPAGTTADTCRALVGKAKRKADGYYAAATADAPVTICLRPAAGGIAVAKVSPNARYNYDVSISYRP